MAMRRFQGGSTRFLVSAAALSILAFSTAGCKTLGLPEETGSIGMAASPTSENDWRRESELWGARYKANPRDSEAAIRYAQALRGIGQRSQAVAVLEQASIKEPGNKRLLGAYGRALADVGNYGQAFDVLSKAHTPDQPDWHILSAQGAVLDQMDRHQEAQRYYMSALKIAPDDPSVLSNLGLSYALSKDLPKAEATLRRATTQSSVDPRVRQNLALVVGLQGRFSEAEDIARSDLQPDEAAANVAYLKQMLSQQQDWKKLARPNTPVGVGGT
jgi:Flp pilus assembly protein TadD